MEKRRRNISLLVRVNDNEKELIQKKMEQFGTCNFMDYARKMLIDGYVIKNECRTDPEIVK